MKLQLAFLFLSCLIIVSPNHLKATHNPHFDSKDPLMGDFTEVVTYLGYPVETHYVTTEDGYILTVFRIPGPRGESLETAKAGNKKVLLYQHGILDSADGIICNVEELNPGLIYPNSGFDTWFANSRGNYYSRKHNFLSTSEKEFWEFSFQDMGYFDLPAMIDYILAHTGKPNLSLLGHSQGTMLTWVALTDTKTKAKLQGKISAFAAWGPVAHLEYATSPLFMTVFVKTELLQLMDSLKMYDLLPRNYLEVTGQAIICKLIPILCEFVLSLLTDSDMHTLREDRLDVLTYHYPSGTTLQNGFHMKELKISSPNRFMAYDNGPSVNLQLYGSDRPADYDFSQIMKIPISMYVGDYDILGDPKDNLWLKAQLEAAGVLEEYHQYPIGHLTFFLAKNRALSQHIYDTLEFFNKHAQ